MKVSYQQITNAHPPNLLTKKVLLCCLCLIMLLAVPIASQAQTPVPTVPPRLNNPTAAQIGSCGLPDSYAQFNANAPVKTFNLTSDCQWDSWDVTGGWAFLYFSAGEFTINGNGYSIIGPPNNYALYAQYSNTTLNLNNVTIRGNTVGRTNGGINAVTVISGATLNANRVIFQGNLSSAVPFFASAGSTANLNDVQFLDNTSGQSGIVAGNSAGTSVVITNAVFRGNTADGQVIEARDGSTMRLEGCIVFENNVRADGVTPATNTGLSLGASLTDNSSLAACLALTPQSPKKKKKAGDPTPAPTSTPRPQFAATHVALQAATGATFGTTFGLDSGVHFRQLDGAGIGVQSIIDAGYLEAFDVWGYVEQGVEVCFSQVGRVIFLDASTSPRAIVPLASTVVNGKTCVSINSPGSLVLLPN